MTSVLRLVVLAVVAVPCALAASGCADATSAADGQDRHLVVTGSSTVAPLVAELARRYEVAHPNVRIDVQTGGSSRGIADARSGLADIGMVSRGLRDDERDLHGVEIARDAICMIVHRDLPVATLGRDEVIAIYTGRIRNWSELGGPDRAITVVHKAEGRSTQELFLAHFGIERTAVRASVIIGDNEQGIKTVAGVPGAVGYVSLGAALAATERGDALRALPMGGVAPTAANLATGRFPLSRPLTLVTATPPTGLVAAFLDFTGAPAAHDVIRELTFVPIDR